MVGGQIVNVITPPAVEPVALADMKNYLRVDIADDDALISALLTTARVMCETRTRRPFITTSFEMVLDNFPFGGGYYNRAIRQQAAALNWLPTNTGIIEIPRGGRGVGRRDPLPRLQWEPQHARDLDLSLHPREPGQGRPVIWKYLAADLPRNLLGLDRLHRGLRPRTASVPPGICTAIMLLTGHLYQNREAVTAGSMAELPIGVDAIPRPLLLRVLYVTIGEMRHRLTYQEPIIKDDDYGDAVTTWETVSVAWGKVSPASGSESVVGEQLRADVSHTVTIRYGAVAARANGRFLLDSTGRILNVVSCLDVDERRWQLNIACKEVNAIA